MRKWMWAVAAAGCLCARGDAWERLSPDEVKVRGEIGRRIDLTWAGNVRKLDLERDFLRMFRAKDRKDAYIGTGQLMETLVRYAKYYGTAEAVELKDRVIGEILKSATADGYLGCMRDGSRLWAYWDLEEAGELIMALVLDHRYFGRKESLAAAARHADYVLSRWGTKPEGWADAAISERFASIELDRGMMYLWEETGDGKYLAFCMGPRKLDCREPVILGRSHGQHGDASTHISQCAAKLMLPEPHFARCAAASRHLMDFLLNRNGMTVAGGSGLFESWVDDQSGEAGCTETCATAYVPKFFDLYQRKFGVDARCADALERVLYNTLFAAQSPDGRRLRYFTNLQGERTYYGSDTYCCCSNYRRVVSELPEYVYYKAKGRVCVNLYTESEAAFALDGARVRIVQRTAYPYDGRVTVAVDAPDAGAVELWLRVPGWCADAPARAGGAVFRAEADGFVKIRRVWKGDTVELDFPMRPRAVWGRARQQGRVAFLRGPVLYGLNPAYNAGGELAKRELKSHTLTGEVQKRVDDLKGFFGAEPADYTAKMLVDPDSAEVVTNGVARPGGTGLRVLAALSPFALGVNRGNGTPLTLTEFIDPGVRATYFRVPDLSRAEPDGTLCGRRPAAACPALRVDADAALRCGKALRVAGLELGLDGWPDVEKLDALARRIAEAKPELLVIDGDTAVYEHCLNTLFMECLTALMDVVKDARVPFVVEFAAGEPPYRGPTRFTRAEKRVLFRSHGGKWYREKEQAEDPAKVTPVSGKVTRSRRENIEWTRFYATGGDAGLPSVLFAGDSIANQYAPVCAERLKGKARVAYFCTSKCVTDPTFPRELELALDAGAYDVISFNNGLHTDTHVEPSDYRAAVERALDTVKRKCPKAKVFLTNSTPLEKPEQDRFVQTLNAAAAEAAAARGVAVHDNYAAALEVSKETRWRDGCHFTSDGVAKLADAMVADVARRLPLAAGDGGRGAVRAGVNYWSEDIAKNGKLPRVLFVEEPKARFADAVAAKLKGKILKTRLLLEQARGDDARTAFLDFVLDEDVYAMVVVTNDADARRVRKLAPGARIVRADETGADADGLAAAVAKELDNVIVLEGGYHGHLQDVWRDAEKDVIYWAHTECVVKTDGRGRVLRRAELGKHHAGLQLVGDELFCAVTDMGWRPKGGKTSGPDARLWVRVFDAETLAVKREHLFKDINDMAGSIARLPDGDWLVGCLRGPGLAPNQVRAHRFSGDFKTYRRPYVFTLDKDVPMGIETIHVVDGMVCLGIYGYPQLRLDARLNKIDERPFDGTLGWYKEAGAVWRGLSRGLKPGFAAVPCHVSRLVRE